MPQGDPNEYQTQEQRRQKGRRLFSLDSGKWSSSTRNSSSDHELPQVGHPQNAFDLSNVQEVDDEQEQVIYAPRATRSSTEPTPQTTPISHLEFSANQPGRSKLEPVRPIAIAPVPLRAFTVDSSQPTPSPTRARWENLRQHVIPSASRPATPPQRPPSAQSSISSNALARSNTPKPSRLARLGFRHVVEQARDVIGDTRKLGEEIKRACAIARYPEHNRPSKEGSTTNLTGTATMASSVIASAKKTDYLRRPQSVSATSLPAANASGSNAPSLRYLYQVLLFHSTESPHSNAMNLPQETYVLSTLLCPFLIPSKYPYMRVEEEQMTAVETFELLAKSWAPINEAATIGRSVWCTRAAASLSPSSTRTRILGLLWRLLVPGDRQKILLTPHGFHSISSSLLLLLAAMYRSLGSTSTGANPYSQSPSFKTSIGTSLAPANFQQPPHPDINLVQDLIPQFLSASLGEVEDDKIEEVYNAEFSVTDRRNLGNIRRALFSESLVTTIGNAPGTGEWLLCNVVERYWPPPEMDIWSALQAVISSRRINSFCRLSLSLLKPFITRDPSPSSTPIQPSRLASSSSVASSVDSFNRAVANVAIPTEIVSILETRVILEAEALDNETELAAGLVGETRKLVAITVLELLCICDDVGSAMYSPNAGMDVFGAPSQSFASGNEIQIVVKWARGKLCQWYEANDRTPWKIALEQALFQIISEDWTRCTCILSALLKHLPENIKKPVFLAISGTLNDQLVDHPPPYPSPRISDFLTSLSRSLPLIFFKPLFACGASDKDIIVANHLCTLQVHSKYVKDYWVRDVDMICFALLGSAKDLKPHESPEIWGVARLGQLVLLVEFIGQIQIIRHQKEATQGQGDGSFGEILRFATAIEARVWSMIEFQEGTHQIPPSLRMLLCILFRELRLLTRSLKPAPWLARTLHWFHTYIEDEILRELEQDVTRAVERIQELYLIAQAGIQERHKRHTSMLAASVHKATPSDTVDQKNQLDLAATFLNHKKLIESLNKGYISKALKLFVAMSSLISAEDSLKLAPLLWQHCLLDNVDPSLTASACFMLMQCTEKAPMEVRTIIDVDMQSSDDTTRLETVRKIGILINWRFQIMNQNFVADRTHRPFKLARPPLPFVATDIGSNLYIPFEDPKETRDKDDVPLELKKRLAELGWTDEDGVSIDPRHELIKTPFSILPVQQWDRQEVGTADVNIGGPPSPLLGSPHPSPRKNRAQHDNSQQMPLPEDMSSLLRRNSSSGGPTYGVKRRAVFVPPLTLIFPRLCTLVFDPNFAVVSAARTTLLDLMRNDPALLTRPMFDLLAGENRDPKLAISTFTALLHVRRVLPPPVAHNIFNNLAGFLKLLARDENAPGALEDFGLVVPIMSSLATQVSGISMREIRRSKIENFLIPTGSLWFPSAAPKGSMFPRSLGSSDIPFEPVSRLVSITMIRVAQNMFFLSMLKRNFQDVQVVRKNMSTLILPSLDDDGLSKKLELQDFMPKKFQPDTRPSMRNGEVEILSLMVARSSILLIAQIFRSMPRHLSDRNELAVLVDGLNRALVAHGDDINIVSHVLIALMVASTRFRRLFTSGNGYTLFMPALVKVYTETPSHPGIRNAIEYAVNRFYALHKDSFLYQTINIIGQMTMLPQVDSSWFSKGIYDLFASLKRGVSPSAADIGGIYNANKAEEREALILHTADEKPQTFLAAIKRVESDTGRHMSFQLPDESENNRLDMPDLVRLFWTIIAHDISISRAQHFLRLLLFLAPHLYNSSSKTKNFLSDGIDAFGQILNKAFAKPKINEAILKSVGRDEDAAFLGSTPGSQDNSKERVRMPSDSKTLRLDYLRLIVAFSSSGGQVTLGVTRYAFDIVRSLLKDWGDTDLDVLANFLADFMKMMLNREQHANPKAIVALLQELSPLLHSPALSSLDLTGVFETILKLTEIPIYASDSHFCQVIVEQICTAGLSACDGAASGDQLMALRYRPILISLFSESIFLKGTDVISELEKRAPTYQYLSAVILPLTLSMKTETQIIADGLMTEQHRLTLAAAWVRILSYATTACQNSRKDADGTRQLRSLAGSFTRSKSGGKGRRDAFWRSHLPTFMTAMQIIKVIIIRGAADISFLPQLGIWERLADFFKTMLAEGSAEFALRAESSSTASTPTGSPRNSGHFDISNSASSLFVSSSSDLSRPSSPISHTERMSTYRRPRIVDYSLWSVLEFACAYRSPLRMQLKVLTMEKVVGLDQALLHQAWSRGGASPFPSSPSSRRISTSLFSKSRQRASGLLGPSPESSPRMMPSSSSLMPSPSFLDIPGRLDIPSRRPGYQVSPSTSERAAGLPKIVHLGPVSPSALSPNVSPLIGGIRASKSGSSSTGPDPDSDARLAKATKIRSLKLIQETYRRIRGVQAYMGYELLLPVPGTSSALGKDRDEDAGLETWTIAQALNAIVSETKDLLEEFEESFGIDEESVLVEMDQTMPSYPNSPS